MAFRILLEGKLHKVGISKVYGLPCSRIHRCLTEHVLVLIPESTSESLVIAKLKKLYEIYRTFAFRKRLTSES